MCKKKKKKKKKSDRERAREGLRRHESPHRDRDDTILLIAREPRTGADLAELCRSLQVADVRA